MVSLRIENHKIRFRSYPNSFNAEAAIANLNNLQVVQSNRGTDPYDPTRIITHVTTTQFSLSRDMARNLCQTFMDARLIESAIDPTKREFQSRGLYQITPKGAHLVAKFVVRNSLPIEESRHITTNSASNMLHVERTDDEDAIILTLKHVDMIFKRFAGPEPNIVKSDVSTAGSGGADSVTASGGSSTTSSTSGRDRSAADSSSGIEIRDQQLNYETYKQTFYGKAAVDWLLDNITVISKEEAICICQEMVSAGYIEQVGEENRDGPSLFKTGNSALYHLTETGRAVAGWKSLDDGNGNSIHTDWMDERSAIGAKGDRSHAESNPLSVQFKLISTSNTSRLPISIVVRENRKSMDEASLSGFQYSSSITGGTNDASTRSGTVAGGMAHASGTNTRRLSQILNDPAFQITLSENGSVVGGSVVAGRTGANGGPMSSYAPSSSGRESVGASAGGSRLSPPLNSTTQSTTSNTSRLNGILSDSVVRDLFKSFLKQNICEENLTFFLEVLDYKSKFSTLISTARSYHQSATGQEQNSWRDADGQNGWNLYPPSLRELEKQICTQAFAIFETYLIQGAPKEVNLPHQMRHDITSYMQAVVRNMSASDVGSGANQSSENKNLPPTPTSPSSASTASSAATLSSLTESRSDADKYTVAGAAAVGGATTSSGGQKELIHISLFDTIHDHIFRLMSTDSVPKFIKTDKYLEVVMSKHKRKAAANAAAATRAVAGVLSAGQEMSRGSMVSDINDSNTHRDNNDGLSTISLSNGNEGERTEMAEIRL
ncbi:hypothetical protein BGZ98_008102 [Dissophora globulifera]|nr:hypothetical protein BGZ98_008102 [Dissophora globulifera]